MISWPESSVSRRAAASSLPDTPDKHLPRVGKQPVHGFPFSHNQHPCFTREGSCADPETRLLHFCSNRFL